MGASSEDNEMCEGENLVRLMLLKQNHEGERCVESELHL